MKKNGFTLVEVIVAIVISAIVALTFTVFIVTETRLRMNTNNEISATREANLAMDHMTRVLRFADPSTIVLVPPTGSNPTILITATIKAGHLDLFPTDTDIEYRNNDPAVADSTNRILYVIDPLGPSPTTTQIVDGITNLIIIWNDPELEIELTAENGDSSVTLNTTIRVMGD